MKNTTPTSFKKINSFWKWFLNHEIEILKALLYQENYQSVFSDLTKKLNTISTQIGYIIKSNDTPNTKLKITFTAHGNKKLFEKVNAIKTHSPKFLHWEVEAFLQPYE